MLALGGAGVSEANGVPPVAGLLDGIDRPFDSATGPSAPLRDRGGPSTPLRGRGGPSTPLRGRKGRSGTG